jgi:hypothetical protein
VGFPYVSLCFFTPQASPARVTIALGASNLQCLSNSKFM